MPSVEDSAAAAQFTGRLNARRSVQMRTLRKEHMDQHWVNAMTRYYLEWLVELKSKYDGVEFFGQDDKAKIPVGDTVAISTGVRANNKGIVAVGAKTGLEAKDHDFHCSNLITAVTLRCNIPSDVSESFFIGDEEECNGQIFVTVRDATFDPSKVIDHCAQLIDALRTKELKPTVLVLQTDGGPDHSLKRVATKMALIATFKELDLDHLVTLRGAPNGSARNKIERSMSVLNLSLAHTALSRADMPPWAEEDIKGCSSMQAIRDLSSKLEKKRKDAEAALPQLEKDCNNFAIAEALASVVPTIFDEINLPEDQVQAAAFSTTTLILRFLGISAPNGSDVAGALVTDNGGVEIIRNGNLPSAIAKSKRDKAVEEASKDFIQEYKTSMAAPIIAISNRFATLETSGRNVIVTPRVPTEAVSTLHKHLTKIDAAYSSSITKTEHMKNVPVLCTFIESHAITTPYSFSIKKCGNVECCGIIRTPLEVRELAMQRQPTLRSDPNRPGHFFRRDQALAAVVNDPNVLTDLSEMPSNAGDKKKALKKIHKERDEKLSKSLILKSWDGKKVRAFVICYHCGKRRCIYTGKDEDYLAAKVAFRQRLESVSSRYSCGGEKGAADFLYSLQQLREKNMTGGFKCFPICVVCLDKKKKVVRGGGKKNEIQARKEREALAAASGN